MKIAAGCLALLALCQPKAGEWTNGPTTLRVQPVPERGVIPLPAPDELQIEIRVEGSDKLEVHPPPAWILTRGWRTHPVDAAKIESQEGKRVWTQRLVAYPPSPGEFELLLAPIGWKDGEQGGEAKFDPIAVRSFSTIDRADIRNLRDPVRLERLPRPTRSRSWLNLVLTIFGVSVGLYAALRGRSRRRADLESHESRALRLLDRVNRWSLPEKEKSERYFTLLSLIARRYLERKHDLPARHRTTPEFLDLLKTRGGLSEEHDLIVRFFNRADRAKFAPQSATAEECRNAEQELREWLESRAAHSTLVPG